MRSFLAAVALWVGSCPQIARGDFTVLAEYHRAWALVAQLRTTEAIPLLDSIVARDKTFHLAYSALARAYSYSRDLPTGERHFRRLIADDPQNALAHFGLGLLFELFQMHDAARREMATCIAQSPAKAYVYVCYSFFPPPARFTDFPERVKHTGDNPYSHLAITVYFTRKGESVAARRAAMAGLRGAQARRDRELEAAYLVLLADLTDDPSQRLPLLLSAQPILRDLGDRDEELQNAIRIAFCLHKLHQEEKAAAAFSQAYDLAEGWGAHYFSGIILHTVAGLLEERGELEESIRLNARAKALLELYPLDAEYFEILRHIGDAYRRRGRIEEAAAEYENLRCAAIRERAHPFEGFALRYLGDLYTELGDYFKALEYQSESFEIFDQLGRADKGYRDASGASLTRIGKIYAALGDYETAESHFRRALRIAMDVRDWDPQERVHIELGTLYLQTSQARQALEELTKAQMAGEKNRQLVFGPPTLLNIGRAYSQLDRLPEAMRSMTESLRAAQRLGMRAEQAEALGELGAAHLRAGALNLAEGYLSQSLAIAESIDSLRLIVPARLGLADLEEARRNRRQSLEHLMKGIQALEEIRSRIPGSSLRAGLQLQSWSVYERARDLLAEEGNGEEAFRLAEAGRARAMLDLIVEGGAQITKGLSSREQERHLALVAAVSRASAAMLNDSSPAGREAVNMAERNLRQWVAETYRTNPEYSQLHYPVPYDLQQARATLPDDETAIVEFALGERRSSAWVVRRSGFLMAELPQRGVLEAAVSAIREAMCHPPKSTGAWEAYQTEAQALYGMLVAPFESHLRGVRRLVVVPDGLLYYLPFETLQHRGRYLVEDFTIVYAPSASAYGNLADVWRRRVRKTPQRELLAFGDSVFGQTSATVRSVLVRNGVSLGRLPYTRDEVEKIGALYPPAQRKTYLGAEATEDALKREMLPRFRRIHFATHAVIDERMPIRSGVLLAPGSQGEDGLLTMAEIFNLELDADLVVLSACQTGLGQLVRGEGMVGLTRAIFYAGSPRVAVSLWEVNDIATARLMEAFYREMRDGESPAMALRKAKLSFLRGNAAGLRHPYFWAPFVLVGLF
ncbi:MAG TPA: CHAT domain-containing protein [Bryobacteraceae bacterium]|nr:CHAT domain-containing protein [Bryobacteraceae bacterium]